MDYPESYLEEIIEIKGKNDEIKDLIQILCHYLAVLKTRMGTAYFVSEFEVKDIIVEIDMRKTKIDMSLPKFFKKAVYKNVGGPHIISDFIDTEDINMSTFKELLIPSTVPVKLMISDFYFDEYHRIVSSFKNIFHEATSISIKIKTSGNLFNNPDRPGLGDDYWENRISNIGRDAVHYECIFVRVDDPSRVYKFILDLKNNILTSNRYDSNFGIESEHLPKLTEKKVSVFLENYQMDIPSNITDRGLLNVLVLIVNFLEKNNCTNIADDIYRTVMERIYSIKHGDTSSRDFAEYSQDEEDDDFEDDNFEEDDDNYRCIKIDQFKFNVDEYDEFVKIKSSIPDYSDSLISDEMKTLFLETFTQIIEEVNDLEYFFESLQILNTLLIDRGIFLSWKIHFYNDDIIGHFAKSNSNSFSLKYNLYQPLGS